MRKALAALAAILLVGIFATAAHAVVTKDGNKGSGSNYSPWVRSDAYGLILHHPPGGVHKTYGHSYRDVDKTYGNFGSGGGYWHVDVSGGALSDPGTYAGRQACTPS